MGPFSAKRIICIALGMLLWAWVALMLISSIRTISERSSRLVERIQLAASQKTRLVPGDSVFLATSRGWERVGQVSGVDRLGRTIDLEIDANSFGLLRAGTIARIWETPLSAETMMSVLFPKVLREQAAACILDGWEQHEEEVAAIWGPLLRDLSLAYLEIVATELDAAVKRHEDRLWRIAQAHGEAMAKAWPLIQERLDPVLQEYVLPVLARILADGFDQAPKIQIAWDLARGRHAEALAHVSRWLTTYFQTMPEHDRAMMQQAISTAWETILSDPQIRTELAKLRDGVLQDEGLRSVLRDIYDEAVIQNERVAEFVRTRVIESPKIQSRLFDLMERFAPTIECIAALSLFDEHGATRAEVVHLVRSLSLGRNVAWVTLEPTSAESAPPLAPGAILAPEPGDRPS